MPEGENSKLLYHKIKYTFWSLDPRRDAGVATIKINKKYTEILSFPMYCKHFVFTEEADGYDNVKDFG